MSTRRADPNAPLSQERYMSSPEFAELHGVNGTAVAKRCALLDSPTKQQLIWFIQGLSLLKGGCKTLAIELLKMFPERVSSGTMHIGSVADFLDDSPEAQPVDYGPAASRKDLHREWLEAAKEGLPDFLTELCINPDLKFPAPEDTEAERWAAKTAKVSYFQDITGALFEYKRRYEEQVMAEFCHTAISRQIWKQLDYALKSRTMIVVDGREGRGKTEAVRAWCKCHLGVARFISLVGTNTKTSHFTEFAKALGVGHSNAHKVSQMQAGVQAVLRTSGLMLVIDEAHHFFNQTPRA